MTSFGRNKKINYKCKIWAILHHLKNMKKAVFFCVVLMHWFTSKAESMFYPRCKYSNNSTISGKEPALKTLIIKYVKYMF